MTPEVTGLRVRKARSVTFNPLDDKRVKYMQVIGRAEVELDDGRRTHAFLVASTDRRDLGKRFAMFFEWRDEPWPAGRVCRMMLAEIDDERGGT